MTLLLTGKTAFVTGAGGGIGRTTAIMMAAEGARVTVTDIDGRAAAATAAMIEADGGAAFATTLDVTDAAACKTAIDDHVARWGGLDCAFNNAGVSLEGMQTPWGDAAAFTRSFDINVTGVLNCMVAELEHMAAAKSGAIVNTASIAGLTGAGGPGYCGSKHAVVGLTRSAAIRYAPLGVRVNCVCPGAIITPMTDTIAKDPQGAAYLAQMHPLGRMGEAHEVADAVVFLLSSRASFITGHPLAVDGGFTAR
jgi:NAD(P)-dependent dehydrogenase (short-subunit alcohol dehydrogenase family)